LEHLDLGGGLGIRYDGETPPSIADYAHALLGVLQGRSEKIIVEPGRVLVGNSGVLLTRVEYIKHGEEKNFAIVDAAMNDLMRPALYDAYHAIRPVLINDAVTQTYEVVGPVCETGDFLGHARELAVSQGDLLAVMSAGAYGMSMSSNYNTRPRAAEVMVSGTDVQIIRERESVYQLFSAEKTFLF
jgi:diaminopimelate decarboxylase